MVIVTRFLRSVRDCDENFALLSGRGIPLLKPLIKVLELRQERLEGTRGGGDLEDDVERGEAKLAGGRKDVEDGGENGDDEGGTVGRVWWLSEGLKDGREEGGKLGRVADEVNEKVEGRNELYIEFTCQISTSFIKT